MDALCLGNLVLDVMVRTDDLPGWGTLANVAEPFGRSLGGNAGIFARRLADLGGSVSVMGFIGEDDEGDRVLSWLEGVDLSHVTRRAGRTATTIALVRADGERAFLHYPGTPGDWVVPEALLDSCTHFFLAGFFLLDGLDAATGEVLLKRAKDAGCRTLLDPSWDPSGQWELSGMLGSTDIFLPNRLELLSLTGLDDLEEAATQVHRLGCPVVAAKLGENGALLSVDGRPPLPVPPFRVEAMDATGAGDAFNAGFVRALTEGSSLEEAVRAGNALGSLSVTRLGGCAGRITRADLEAAITGRTSY